MNKSEWLKIAIKTRDRYRPSRVETEWENYGMETHCHFCQAVKGISDSGEVECDLCLHSIYPDGIPNNAFFPCTEQEAGIPDKHDAFREIKTRAKGRLAFYNKKFIPWLRALPEDHPFFKGVSQ